MKKARRASKRKTAPTKAKSSAKTSSKSKIKKTVSKKTSFKKIVRRTFTPPDQAIVAAIEPLSILQTEPPPLPVLNDLPFSYNETKLTLMVRDPYWAYAYWDFSAETWNWIVVFRERTHEAKPKLRIHNLENGEFHDLDISLDARNWYVELGVPYTAFEAELGFLDSSGKFHGIVRSNRVRTPRSGPSDKIDDAWNLNDLEFSEIYRLSGGGKTGYGSEIFSSLKRRSS